MREVRCHTRHHRVKRAGIDAILSVSRPCRRRDDHVDGFKYTDVTVPPGAQVTVVNNDSAEHTVTADSSGAFNVEVDDKHQATFTAPTQPGTYPFHCTYHPSMHGVLTVQ